MLNPLNTSRTRHGAEDEDIACESEVTASTRGLDPAWHRRGLILIDASTRSDRLQVMGAREGAIKVCARSALSDESG